MVALVLGLSAVFSSPNFAFASLCLAKVAVRAIDCHQAQGMTMVTLAQVFPPVYTIFSSLGRRLTCLVSIDILR
jgi:hypothetical protein